MSTIPVVAVPGESLTPAVQAFRLVITLAQDLRTLMDQRLQASELTTQQSALLTVIEIKGSAPTMTEAARLLGMSHQNVKQLAVALERKGFLEIVPDEKDARSKRMQTTKKHRKFWAKRNPEDHACVAEWLAGLDQQEQSTLVKLLAKALTSARNSRASGTREE
jgi:DNA-binding MarR family transcriptional regulator